MRIALGSSRIVYVGEYEARKVPYFTDPASLELSKAVARSLLRYKSKLKTMLWLGKFLVAGDDWEGSPAWCMRGFWANWRESHSWQDLQGIVLPTQKLLGGVMTVQPTTHDIPPLEKNDLFRVFSSRVSQAALYCRPGCGVSHALENYRNFGELDGAVYMRDFGDAGVIDTLMQDRRGFRNAMQALTEIVRHTS